MGHPVIGEIPPNLPRSVKVDGFVFVDAAAVAPSLLGRRRRRRPVPLGRGGGPPPRRAVRLRRRRPLSKAELEIFKKF